MSPFALAALVLPALVLPSLVLPSQSCRKCKGEGTLACGSHSEELHAFEARVQFCSVAARCTTCRGALRVDCPRCADEASGVRIQDASARAAAWLAENEIERHLNRPVVRLETARFQLIVETGERRDGKQRVDEHTLGHRVAADVERVAHLIAEHFEVVDGDYDAKMRMWIWNDPKDHLAVMKTFLHTSSTGDFTMLGRAPVFSVWTEPPFFDSVPEIRSLFAHNAGHMLTSNMLSPMWVGDIGGGWLDAAVGHWYEYTLFERTLNQCIEEATGVEPYKQGRWRAAIRKRLSNEDERFLPQLLGRTSGSMSPKEHALCWSFYDWLVAVHAKSLRAILADLKAKRPTREILSERIGRSVLEAEADWRAWVPEHYPKKGDAPVRPRKR